MSIALWAENLTGTHYYANVVPSAFGDDAVPGAPRTYGVRASFNF